jgi:tripartite-type tricarboxylate transporter receptor subunit TctC
MELTRDPQAIEVFRLLIATDEIGRSLFTTPRVPSERIGLLRSAFQMMLADPEFRTEAEQLKLPLAPRAGDELQQTVADTFKITPSTMAVIKEVIRP